MKTSIYQRILERIDGGKHLHPLLLEVLEEASEGAENAEIEGDKVSVALLVFKTNISLLKGILKGAFNKADNVTLNYRNKSFDLTVESLIYQQLVLISDGLSEIPNT